MSDEKLNNTAPTIDIDWSKNVLVDESGTSVMMEWSDDGVKLIDSNGEVVKYYFAEINKMRAAQSSKPEWPRLDTYWSAYLSVNKELKNKDEAAAWAFAYLKQRMNQNEKGEV